jgi:hypothetical protein
MAATATQQQSAPAQQIEAGQVEDLLDRILSKAEKTRGQINLLANGAVDFGNWEGIQRYARVLVEAGVVPTYKDDTPERRLARTIVAINLGRRVGMNPEEAVQSIYVVNSRANIFGDAPLAICRQHSSWVESGYEEYFEVDGRRVDGDPDPKDLAKETTACVCKTLRKGAKEQMVRRFSMAHAKQAGLLSKNGSLYAVYGQRMLRFRARGYCLRDNFGDALRGIGIRELVDLEPDQVPEQEGRPPDSGRQSLRQPRTQTVVKPTEETNGHEAPSLPAPSNEATPQADTPAVPPDADPGAEVQMTIDEQERREEVRQIREEIAKSHDEATWNAAATRLTRHDTWVGPADHAALLEELRAKHEAINAAQFAARQGGKRQSPFEKARAGK